MERYRLKKAFSLIESLVAIVILSVAITSIYSFMGITQKAINDSFEKNQLNLVLNEMIEDISIESDLAFLTSTIVLNKPSSISKNEKLRVKWETKFEQRFGNNYSDRIKNIKVQKTKSGDFNIINLDAEFIIDGKTQKIQLKRIYNEN